MPTIRHERRHGRGHMTAGFDCRYLRTSPHSQYFYRLDAHVYRESHCLYLLLLLGTEYRRHHHIGTFCDLQMSRFNAADCGMTRQMDGAIEKLRFAFLFRQ